MSRAKRFYDSVLQTSLREERMNGAHLALFPAVERAVAGALVRYDGFEPSEQGTLVYLNAGDDLGGPLARVEQAGGAVIMDKALITPEIGYMAIFRDSEGNRVAFHSPS